MPETIPTITDLAERAEQELRLSLDPLGEGDVDLHDGSRATALVSMQVGLASRVTRYAADRVAATRISTAEGDDLDEAAADEFGETGRRKEAIEATGSVRLSRGGGRPATTIPQGSRFAVPAAGTSPAVVFAARRTVAVLANETTVDVPLVAVEAGTSGNITDPATLSQILDVLPDTTWTVAAPPGGTVFGGGDDRELDDDYRARLSVAGTDEARTRGTAAAILLGALSVPGVRYAQAIEPLNGTVALYVGDPAHALPSALRDAVASSLRAWRCLGVPVDIRPFTVVDVPVTAFVYMTRALTAYDIEALRVAAIAAVQTYFDNRVNADEYFQDMIAAAIASVHPEVQHVSVTNPGTSEIRPADTAYASLLTINRYRVRPESIRVTFSNPLTV